jgi:hypothetical protein
VKLLRVVFMSAFGPVLALACREQPASRFDDAGPRSVNVFADAQAMTVVVGNDPAAAPEQLVPEPELAADVVDAGPRPESKMLLRVLSADTEVFWGAKRLGIAKRGEPFEIVRPQHSGPVDLLLRAPGFLPYHTRLFSDRDDRITVDLVRPTQAPSLNGWRPDEMPKDKPRTKTEKKTEKNRARAR